MVHDGAVVDTFHTWLNQASGSDPYLMFVHSGDRWMAGCTQDFHKTVLLDGVRMDSLHGLNAAFTPLFVDGQPAWFGTRGETTRWYVGSDSSSVGWDQVWAYNAGDGSYWYTGLWIYNSGFVFQAIRDGHGYLCRVRRAN